MSRRLRESLAAHWPFNGHAKDVSGHGYHGTLYNTPTWGRFLNGRQSIEFDGDDQYSGVGDILELNAVSAYTICFWMDQDALGGGDTIFRKNLDGNNNINILTPAPNSMKLTMKAGANTFASFDYSTVVSANNWHHYAQVFDGSGAANADRFIVYVDGEPVTLAFSGAIPAVTADLSGVDTTIGASAVSFDGELHDFRIATVPYTRDEVIQVINAPVPFAA